MRRDPPKESTRECWKESGLQQRLRRSIRRLAVNSVIVGPFGRCEHREAVDDLETRLFLAESPETFRKVAQAIADHLGECGTVTANSSPVAKGIQLYTELNYENPVAERAAGVFLAEVALTEQQRPASARRSRRPLMDVASYIGYAVAGSVTRKRAQAALIAAANRLFQAAWDRPARTPSPTRLRDRS
jgi:hypothetical protein